MATLTAVTQDVWPVRVLLTLTGLTAGDDVAVYRMVGGVRTLVRATAVEDVPGTSLVRVDAELPFGVPVTYLAVVNGADDDTAGPVTYTLEGGKVAVTDAILGLAAEVVILAWPERSFNRRASGYAVGGRNVAVLGPWPMFAGAAELYVDSTSARDSLALVLAAATEGYVQIRQPGGYDGIDSYVAVLGAAERRMSQDGSDPRRVFALDLLEVEGWAPELQARGYTYGDVATFYTGVTYATATADFATYLAAAQGDFST